MVGREALNGDVIGSYLSPWVYRWIHGSHLLRFFVSHYYLPSVLLHYVCLIAIYCLVTDRLFDRSPDRLESVCLSGVLCRLMSVNHLAPT